MAGFFKTFTSNVRQRRQLLKKEKEADKASIARAESEARQLRRESRAEYIKKQKGKYTPLSERLKNIKSARTKRTTTFGLVRDPLASDKPNPWVDQPKNKKKNPWTD